MTEENFDPYDFSKKELSGVHIYYKNLPWAPCIHIRIAFKTGAFDDPVGKEGLSHFLEHMILDGSPTLPNKKVIKEWSKLHALNTWNAWTNFYQTVYWLKCLPEEYSTVLAGMKDMIFNSYLKSEDVEHERKIITQESWNRFLNQKYLAYVKEMLETLFSGHDHSRFFSALGWPDTIAQISHEDIALWHKQHYGIGNFYIVLAGAVDKKHVDSLEEFLRDLPHIDEAVKKTGTIGKPRENRFVKTADEIGEVKEQVEITFTRIIQQLPRSKNQIALGFRLLLSDILNERLRIEHSLCYSINVSIYLQKSLAQIFMTVKTDEKNIELVEKEFWNVLKEIKEGTHIERFAILKKVSIEQIRSQELLSGNIADSVLGDVFKYDGHIVTQKEQLEEMEKVTYEDVVEFGTQAFDPDFTHTEIILPSKK